ncbi:hypothetical protein BT69DRAFT_1347671 [Atractiella rhizophila]|nr:hypothetical protein BT69DRAFT_1347671 [Atractiella rhizophila]
MEAFISKLKEGKSVKVGVLGGSVSRGHATQHSPGGVRQNSWPWRAFDAINTTFPNPQHEMHNGAVAAVLVSYYEICWTEHIPDDVDIVFVELDINSERTEEEERGFDAIYRGVLGLPSEPAVVAISTFGLVFEDLHTGFPIHLPIAIHNDIPFISLRPSLIPHILLHPQSKDLFFYHPLEPNPELQHDYRHINVDAHEMLADFFAFWFEKQICEWEGKRKLTERGEGRWLDSGEKFHTLDTGEYGGTPPLRYKDPFPYGSRDTLLPAPPKPDDGIQCSSLSSARQPLNCSAKYSLATSSVDGWTQQTLNDKKFFVTRKIGSRIAFDVRIVAKKGIASGSRNRFSLQREESTEVGLFVWLSPTKGADGMGMIGCWIDGLHTEPQQGWTEADWTTWDGGLVNGWNPWGGPNKIEWTGNLFWEGNKEIPSGDQTLICQLLDVSSSGGKEFRIAGLTTRS